MRIISVKLNCTTERELYRTLGNLIVTQKLLNDYLPIAKNRGIGPEGYSEEWMEDYELEGPIKDDVSRFFFSSLQLIGRSES